MSVQEFGEVEKVLGSTGNHKIKMVVDQYNNLHIAPFNAAEGSAYDVGGAINKVIIGGTVDAPGGGALGIHVDLGTGEITIYNGTIVTP